MAVRPVFLPQRSGSRLVSTENVEFHWHGGMSASQKKKNVRELHQAAALRGIEPILETSSKSDFETGRRLSAFYLPLQVEGKNSTVESVFQGSKVFSDGGPYRDLYLKDSREAKLDERLVNSGRLVSFNLNGVEFPLSPPTLFYDWIYLKAIYPYRDWLSRLENFKGFTDIEFNPSRSVNCQARSCALFVALYWRGYLELANDSFEDFIYILSSAYI